MQKLSAESLSHTDTLQQMSLEDLAVEVGDMSLDESDCNWHERTNNGIINLEVMQQNLPIVNSKGGSSEGFSESSCTQYQEPSSSWGDFESFRESLDKLKRFRHNVAVLVKSTKTCEVDLDLSRGHYGTSAGHFCYEPSQESGIQVASSSLNEANYSYEDIFKMGFPEVFVSQSRESVRSLDQVLDTNNDVGIPELRKNQLCIHSGNIWRTLTDFDNIPSLRHTWGKSHCQETLLSVLGIEANQKDCSESQDNILEEPNVKDNENFRFDGFNINDCKALIQTKLSVSPDSRNGLFSYNLFLKATPPNGNMQYVTTPRRKHLFTTHSDGC